jgi:hypothetical protein
MKTKSNMTVKKLQSEAVLEFKKNYGNIIQLASGIEGGQMSTSNIHFIDKDVEQFLSDQIQKAYSKGREEVLKEIEAKQKDENDIYDKIKFIIENPPLPNKKLIKAFKEFKNLSIQSKGNMK